jgi:hypothetical protein
LLYVLDKGKVFPLILKSKGSRDILSTLIIGIITISRSPIPIALKENVIISKEAPKNAKIKA